MPSSLPAAADLFAVVREFLSSEISPQLPAHQQFQMRVADRLLEILEREMRLGAGFDAQETSRLSVLLDTEGSLRDMNAELCARIRDGRLATDDPALLAHLRQTTEDALRINTPKWLARAS